MTFTYDVWGAGFTLHLSGIDVGAHYYLNVSQGISVAHYWGRLRHQYL